MAINKKKIIELNDKGLSRTEIANEMQCAYNTVKNVLNSKKVAKPKIGRPSLYKPEYDEQTYKLCLLGAIDNDLADFFGVQVSTISNWKLNEPTFMESLKKGKMMADANVAQSLYKRATGFKEVVSTKEVEIDGNVVTLHEDKYFPPDPVSAIFWLKNRQSTKWRDKQDVEHKVSRTIVFEDEEDNSQLSQNPS